VVVTRRPDEETDQDPSLLNGLPEDLVVYRTYSPNHLALCSHLWARLKAVVRRQRPAANGTGEGKTNGREQQAPQGWVDWVSRWLQVPDLRVSWVPWGVSAARRAILRHSCRALYSSAPDWSAHLIALLAKGATDLPWVADFRDPWRASPFRKIPYRSVDGYDAWLERRVVESADWVVCNTNPLREDFYRRYPELGKKFVTIPNGFDPEDYAGLSPRRLAGPDKVVLTHAGVFYSKRRPDVLFQALALLERRNPGVADLLLQLVGTPTYEGNSLQEIAARYGVAHLVRVVGTVPHQEALGYMQGSDIQVLAGFSGPGAELQVPAKLFEYFGVGRPILALAPDNSAIADTIAQSGLLAEICDPDRPEEVAQAVSQLVTRLKKSRTTGPAGLNLQQFHRREQVGRIAALLAAPHGSLPPARRNGRPAHSGHVGGNGYATPDRSLLRGLSP
jgi:glycosyltransferase involved in cell wall biosynthesis